jgi:hypothetical protein
LNVADESGKLSVLSGRVRRHHQGGKPDGEDEAHYVP